MQKTVYICFAIILLFTAMSAAQIRDDVKASMEKDEDFYWVPEGPNVTEMEYAGEFIHPDETVRPGNAGITRLVGDTVYVHDMESGYILKYGLDGRYLGKIDCEPIKGTTYYDLAIDEKERFVFIENHDGRNFAHFFDGLKLKTSRDGIFSEATVSIIGDDVFIQMRNHDKSKKHLVARFNFSGDLQEWIGNNDRLFPNFFTAPNPMTHKESSLWIGSFSNPQVIFLDTKTGEQDTITFTIRELLNWARDSQKQRFRVVEDGANIASQRCVFYFIQWFDNRLYLGTATTSISESITCFVVISLSADRTNVHYYRYIHSTPHLQFNRYSYSIIIKRNNRIHLLTPAHIGERDKKAKFSLGLFGPAKLEIQ